MIDVIEHFTTKNGTLTAYISFAGRKTFKCPFCEKVLLFYAAVAPLCSACRNPIINVLTLTKDPNYRLAYHFGSIDLRGRKTV